MQMFISSELVDFGITEEQAENLANTFNEILSNYSAEKAWDTISKTLLTYQIPFSYHLKVFNFCYPLWPAQPQTAPAYIPNDADIQATNLYKLKKQLKLKNVRQFHQWSIDNQNDFIEIIINKLNIKFKQIYYAICDLAQGIETPHWFKGSKLNIIDSCFSAHNAKTALIFRDKNSKLQTMSYSELNKLSNRVANSLIQQGFKPQDPIAINMPMTKDAVAIYLGIIKMGGIVVSIADSFSPEEITIRLKITNTQAIFTQDVIERGKKLLKLYEKVISANAPLCIVISYNNKTSNLRENDLSWDDFLITNDCFTSCTCNPMSAINILFSSGTTGEPKAIPWNHTTAIKAASDAYLHQDIHPNDILAWPTNLGWMMGPWLIFAALINQASIALYEDAPRDTKFGEFIQDAKVTMLGVVPTLVSTWRQSKCMEGLNWQHIRLFSSTGECSNPEDMLYLMSLAGYKPIIEYCGGTEIGGSYLTSTLLEKNYPSLFSTPAIGINLVLIDEDGNETNNGEVALIPPSLGLSTQLLNANHDEIYFANMPTYQNKILRRHGDQAQRLVNGYYCLLGRIDDTMNLGGIKISSAEIERVLVGIPNIIESAAIAITPPNNGPSQLVIYAATQSTLDRVSILKLMQMSINQHLNPLFKIHDLVFINELPKTASNKIMRRALRNIYIKS